MALQSHAFPDNPIIELDEIDSTNNYAMGLLNADKACTGLTIVARSQTKGKGQRGRVWQDSPGATLSMSIIVEPERGLDAQFVFIAQVALAVADALQELNDNMDVAIKWPNDIIVNDKKAGGILIENVIKGSHWPYAVIGLGLNVLQTEMPTELPHATSLKIATGKDIQMEELINLLRSHILAVMAKKMDAALIIQEYNKYLFRQGQIQKFARDGAEWEAKVLQANPNGTLKVALPDGTENDYTHGVVNWQWD